MPETTYIGRGIAKQAGSYLLAGSGDAASAAAAALKVEMLDDILQEYFQARGESFNDSDIGLTDVKKAIIYARGKKQSKTIRKGVIASSKLAIHIAATATGATLGSVVPIAGTALGGIGGYIAGMGLSGSVTVADRLKRGTKGVYKWFRNTRGAHRLQAAQCLMYSAAGPFNRSGGRNPATEALQVILGDEYERIMAQGVDGVERVADRLKSN